MATIGYARVSTKNQDFSAQVEALEHAGAARVYKEKESGVKTDRSELIEAISALHQYDTLLVTRLDRLARSTSDLLNTIEAISQKRAYIKSLNEPWADTTTPQGRMITTVFAGIAQFERELILHRTSEGRERAIAAGIQFGRPPSLTPKQKAHALKLSNQYGNKHAAEILGVSISTIERVRAEARNKSLKNRTE